MTVSLPLRFDLETKDNQHEIVHIEPGSPADIASILPGKSILTKQLKTKLPGDVVIEVNDQSVTGITHEQIIEWIQKSTALRMTILKSKTQSNQD